MILFCFWFNSNTPLFSFMSLERERVLFDFFSFFLNHLLSTASAWADCDDGAVDCCGGGSCWPPRRRATASSRPVANSWPPPRYWRS